MAAHAFAWGAQGHEVIASVAWQRLNPQARQEVTRLLALEPGQTLESIATWADEHRSPATGVWHYVNFPRTSCKYEPERDCPGGRCVVAAIAHQASVFASHASDAERLKALKYLVHLVGDVHQPLHAGYQDDRGGNRFQLQLWMHARNLHAVWDSGLLRNVDLDNEAFSALLRRVPLASDFLDLDPAHMAQESCRIVAQAGFYPDTGLSAAYTQLGFILKGLKISQFPRAYTSLWAGRFFEGSLPDQQEQHSAGRGQVQRMLLPAAEHPVPCPRLSRDGLCGRTDVRQTRRRMQPTCAPESAARPTGTHWR